MEEKKSGRAYFGVQTRKKLAHRNRNKRPLLDKVFAYLKSDCYMYAPLVSLPPSGFDERNPTFFPAAGLKLTEPSKGRENGLAKKIGDYMKSNSYMYASLVAPPPSPSSLVSGQFHYIERVSIKVSTTLVTQGDERTFQSQNMSVKDQPSKHNPSGAGTSDQQALGQKEMVKHMFYENCRSSASGEGVLDSKLTKLILD